MSEPWQVRHVTGAAWLERIARFRVEVWQHHDMIDPDQFPEGRCLEPVDQDAIQIVIVDGDTLVASCRLAIYPDIHATHHGDYYRQANIELEGTIGIPEHSVVHPNLQQRGLQRMLIDEIVRVARQLGVRHTLSECAPAVAEMLRKRGRVSLGKAPPDPRFPGIDFEFMLTDIEKLARDRHTAGGQA